MMEHGSIDHTDAPWLDWLHVGAAGLTVVLTFGFALVLIGGGCWGIWQAAEWVRG